jgi:hypothetical protein
VRLIEENGIETIITCAYMISGVVSRKRLPSTGWCAAMLALSIPVDLRYQHGDASQPETLVVTERITAARCVM